MSSSSSNTGSSGFGITLHHEGQNYENSIDSSPSGGTGDPLEQAARKNSGQLGTNQSTQQGTINEDDIKNNKP
jgi:hypothetical protein